MPAYIADDQPGERGQGRVEGLQDRERRGLGTRDGMPAGAFTQEGGQRLHLRQFRHARESTFEARQRRLATRATGERTSGEADLRPKRPQATRATRFGIESMPSST